MGASVSYHTRCGLVSSRLGCNSKEKVIVGMYNTISVVKLIVDIYCDHGKLHSLLYFVVVMSIVAFFFGSHLLPVFVRLCNLAGAPCPTSFGVLKAILLMITFVLIID